MCMTVFQERQKIFPGGRTCYCISLSSCFVCLQWLLTLCQSLWVAVRGTLHSVHTIETQHHFWRKGPATISSLFLVLIVPNGYLLAPLVSMSRSVDPACISSCIQFFMVGLMFRQCSTINTAAEKFETLNIQSLSEFIESKNKIVWRILCSSFSIQGGARR